VDLGTGGVGDGVVEVVAGVGGGGGISEALSMMLGNTSSGREKPERGLKG